MRLGQMLAEVLNINFDAEFERQHPRDEAGRFTFYRGTVPGSTKRIDEPFEKAKGKTFIARKRESAQQYGQSVEVIKAKPDAKILFQESPEFWKLLGRRRPPNNAMASVRGGVIDAVNTIIERAEKAGYDAVSFTHDADIGTVILKEDAFIRNAG